MKNPEMLADRPLSSWGQRLVEWYQHHRRTLPWRRSEGQADPWAVLVSEIMLQQTRVDVVIPYFERFLQRFPHPASLAEASSEELMSYWSGLGYYRRARSLQACAQALHQRGGFPQTREELLELPGIGPYTSAALTSIALGQPAVALDGNALRVLARLFALGEDITRRSTQQTLEQLTLPAIPVGNPGDFTQAVMELGATVCLPRQPRCLLCPLQEVCQARHLDPHQFPQGKKTLRKEEHFFDCILPVREERVWLTREHGLPFLQGLWMPPLESVQEREGLPLLGNVRHGVTFRSISIRVLLGEPPSQLQGRWLSGEELASIGLPSLARKILKLAGFVPVISK